MNKLHLKIVTPEQLIFEDDVEEIIASTIEGQIGVLPHHANLMAQIIPGELVIKNNGKETLMAVGSGILQMSDNNLIVATDLAEKAEDIDEKIVEQAKKRAEEALEQTQTDEEYAMTMANLEKALAQLKVKRRIRSR